MANYSFGFSSSDPFEFPSDSQSLYESLYPQVEYLISCGLLSGEPSEHLDIEYIPSSGGNSERVCVTTSKHLDSLISLGMVSLSAPVACLESLPDPLPSFCVEFLIKRFGSSDREVYRYSCTCSSSGLAERLGMDYLDSQDWVSDYELRGVLHFPSMTSCACG